MPLDRRDWLRTLVLKTNRIWPLRQCNRLPYAAALRLFVVAFRRHREIASIYLSHGLAGNEWIPGLSDIDLTVILESGLSVEEEYDLLERFWSTYDRLKRYCPMLGELVILEEADFGLWQTYSSTTEQGRHWVLLHGRETAKPVAVDAAAWRKRALNAALWMHLESLLPCLSRPDCYLRQQDLVRRARKIVRYLGPVAAGDVDGKTEVARFRDSAEMVAFILKVLESAARTVAGVASPVPVANGNGVRGVISTDAGRVLMALEDGLETGVIRRLIRDHFRPERDGTAPLLLPHSLFAYMVCHYNPFLHSNLLLGRTVVSGEDPLLGIGPPGRSEFAAYTLNRIAYLLTMTRGEELLSARRTFSLPVLESAVTNGLAVSLFLRDDWVGSDKQAVDAECRSKFPECYRALQTIRDYLAAGREREARRASFRLFRTITAGILDLTRGPADRCPPPRGPLGGPSFAK